MKQQVHQLCREMEHPLVDSLALNRTINSNSEVLMVLLIVVQCLNNNLVMVARIRLKALSNNAKEATTNSV